MLTVAHIAHWYESLLFGLPMLIIGGMLWYSARKERDRPLTEAERWYDEDGAEWNDPRLDD